MTRINCAIKPSELTSKHLLAELREIKRIPNCVVKLDKKINKNRIPKKFTLGTGHVLFFYDKLDYLYNRYKNLRIEALNRNYNVSDFSESFENAIKLRIDLANGYTETMDDRKILIERLKERDFSSYKNLN